MSFLKKLLNPLTVHKKELSLAKKGTKTAVKLARKSTKAALKLQRKMTPSSGKSEKNPAVLADSPLLKRPGRRLAYGRMKNNLPGEGIPRRRIGGADETGTGGDAESRLPSTTPSKRVPPVGTSETNLISRPSDRVGPPLLKTPATTMSGLAMSNSRFKRRKI